MSAALNTGEPQSKQPKEKYDDVLNYKIGDLVMIKKFWQLEVSDPMGTTRKVNVCDAHKIMLSDHIISSYTR